MENVKCAAADPANAARQCRDEKWVRQTNSSERGMPVHEAILQDAHDDLIQGRVGGRTHQDMCPGSFVMPDMANLRQVQQAKSIIQISHLPGLDQGPAAGNQALLAHAACQLQKPSIMIPQAATTGTPGTMSIRSIAKVLAKLQTDGSTLLVCGHAAKLVGTIRELAVISKISICPCDEGVIA